MLAVLEIRVSSSKLKKTFSFLGYDGFDSVEGASLFERHHGGLEETQGSCRGCAETFPISLYESPVR